MSEIIVARSAGFCFGVSRSVSMAESMLQSGQCYSYGPLIHNADVVEELKNKGLTSINKSSSVKPGDRVIIRAHGVSKAILDELKQKKAVISDATCPKVLNIHSIVSQASENGEFVLIIGTRSHPEVEGICSRCKRFSVIESEQEMRHFLNENPDICTENVHIVVQTTQTEKNFIECCNTAKKLCTNLKISDTICPATSMRQKEAAELSSYCKAMVVIGGSHSANSIHLAEICRQNCADVFFVSNASELDTKKLSAFSPIGITAGASTPSWIIKEVRNKMNDEILVEESAAKEPSFDEMLEESLKSIYNGDKVTGIVVAITGTEVSVDLGTKYSGFIPSEEFTSDGIKVEDAVKVGDSVDAIVVRVNDVEGTAQLSKKRLDAIQTWVDLEEAVNNGTVLEGTVVEENKGGVVVNVKGIRVFVPASQTDLPKEAELSQLLKQNVKLKITEVNKARKRVVGSIRRATQSDRRVKIDAIWNEIEVGKKYHGVVKSLTSYGAFVDIGGIDGMVHVTELTWGRIHQPSEVVAVGDEIDVYVISFDKEKRRISLGYKDPNANPWAVFTSRYNVGDVASVKIVKLMDFGAFAEVVPGVDGLIHISQIANRRLEKPGEVLSVGDVVDAKITAVDEEKNKVSLSIRALSAPEPAPEASEDEEDTSDIEAVVYEVSENGEAFGEAPEATEE